ncbi:SAICAR synthase-like protein [Karstenula rhodostoma CBS 690.94]|uniref:1-phosphatidylinositol-4-phosphate 5-kinase n=1 Tax=Karstenula rhodostoma CBS 690.94 TaxID=1392251 RepID=A0A9P4PH60_9PLEO|nr:SAICAR synthase-like protein [Karstenula rhodostoma CBS 690.94]
MIATVVASRTMPSSTADQSDSTHGHTIQTYTLPSRTLSDKSLFGADFSDKVHHGSPHTTNGAVMQSIPNGRPVQPSHPARRTPQQQQQQVDGSAGRQRGSSVGKHTPAATAGPHRLNSGAPPGRDDGYFASVYSSEQDDGCTSTHVTLNATSPPVAPKTSTESQSPNSQSNLQIPGSTSRVSSPPAFNHTTSPVEAPYRLQHRHTLEVPSVSAARAQGLRNNMNNNNNNADDVVTASGRFSPVNTPTRRRGSMSLARRATRSIHSDMHLDEVPQDEDAARWAEHIRQKRASKRKRRDDDDDDRVVVGTKVDQNHVNWVTAYNMLTGIRFTVSRTNAKMDRDLTDADFDAKQKFSFDIAGNELTPSAKYDFKFKDYAPWVFRHLRSIFGLDPADYLVSLTSKYILSELGSPGKSGSFFYFSRDYKYIIKTIHHGEHKFLRKILKDYYNHVQENPNTLLSQFYGLHRVKIPYGRKIHFVVMNNLFPPHRDIHRTFDLKGSTIGRNFQEEGLEANPRATLKDLNWLRRDQHLEFGPEKKKTFVEQMQRDVKLLQKLHIMDYSMLIGIHDVEKGNEENLRDKTLQVFQPGGEQAEDAPPTMLTRTPSKLESARKAKELRQMIKTQKPVPMDQTATKMPDELQGQQKNNYFYVDDGGFRATHEDDTPGEEIYYLGIIDCLTHYNLIKRIEHRWKGLMAEESQISAIPPERYGDRFLKFLSSITKTREAAEREKAEESAHAASDPVLAGINDTRSERESTEKVLHKAHNQAEHSKRHGASEEDIPKREMRLVRSPSAERGELGTTLPVVEEAQETSSTGGRSARSTDSNFAPPLRQEDRGLQNRLRERDQSHGRPPPTPPKDSGTAASEERPPTPPKDTGYAQRHSGPPTPPKEERGRGKDKDLPHLPPMETVVRVN